MGFAEEAVSVVDEGVVLKFAVWIDTSGVSYTFAQQTCTIFPKQHSPGVRGQTIDTTSGLPLYFSSWFFPLYVYVSNYSVSRQSVIRLV